jgi:glutamate dehydrogenase
MSSSRATPVSSLLAAVDGQVVAARGPEMAIATRYWRDAAADDLLCRRADDAAGLVLAHIDLAASRPDGTIALRVFTPTVAEHGWSTGHTLVQVVVEDMPFLVDSVVAALSQLDVTVHELIHPVLVVRRDVTGMLVQVLADEPPARSERGTDRRHESWITVEIGRETDEATLAQIEATLRRVLRDVAEAVEDYPKMRQRALDAAADVLSSPLPVSDAEVTDAEELLRWLADDHFTFLGFREYRLDIVDGQDVLRPVTGTGLGILRSDGPVSAGFAKLPPGARAKAREKHLLVLTKANSRSTVHRPAHMDYVGVKVFEDGEVVGERRFLGLLSSSAYYESVMRVPLLREKARRVMVEAGYAPASHNAKDLLHVLETYPRDELFQTPVEFLVSVARSVVGLQDRGRLRLFVRPDDYGRFLSCLVYLPRDRYNTDVRLAVQKVLIEATGGESIDYTARVGESLLARLHVVIGMPGGQSLPALDLAALQNEIAAAIRDWSDEFGAALVEAVGEERAASLGRRYRGAFSDGYREDFSPRVGVADVLALESLAVDSDLSVTVYHPPSLAPDERRFKIYRTGSELALTQVLPILTALGVDVDDEWPYDIDRADGSSASIYDFGLRVPSDSMLTSPADRSRFEQTFVAVWEGAAENDGFNSLVVQAGMTWRECAVLRAYAKYVRQVGSAFSQAYIEQTLREHPSLAAGLVALFEAMLAPLTPDRPAAVATAMQQLETGLDQVAGLDQDRILRSILQLVQATLRTNHFQTDQGIPKPYLSLKLDCAAVPGLPAPRPLTEMWVCSPQVEGIHLRFGQVARGGLRWSDRREDFRTEVLGLVKAQAVKNSVIVPVGAKGGFVVKGGDRTQAYVQFIRGLLDLTDNRVVDGAGAAQVVPPPDVVRRDGDDSYLVVAADKGTATMSDVANGVSADYRYWLGDAFASGGSAGYDHKAMGITARGAWESVRRHFRNLGRGIDGGESGGLSIVGVGDMSGDVFGNAMLLSTAIALIGAFDHRHIFLDPDPDPQRSFDERRRLFGLARSSWADYDRALVSAGGGVWARTAKTVPVSPQVRARLGLAESVTSLTPPEMIRALLMAPVDLLFNGGIGTYVKAAGQSNGEVGDKANDAVRVDADELRCLVVAEGGNLGLTQPARIAYARGGGRVNTDAIDNSAGVDTSDREVNIKIVLDGVVAAGELTGKQRDALLATMTDEVAALVLRTNYRQNVALEMALAQAPALVNVHEAYLTALVDAGSLDRVVEDLPDEREVASRRAAGTGFVGPELAVLMAYTKNMLFDDLLDGALPDDPELSATLSAYFPTPVAQRYPDQVARHPLRREILSSQVANRVVDEAGITFLHRLGVETAASVEELTRAHLVAAEVFGRARIADAIDDLDLVVDSSTQVGMRLEARTLIERAARWFVLSRPAPLDLAREIEMFAEPVAAILAALPTLLVGRAEQEAADRRDALTATGVPADLATAMSVLPWAFPALDVADICQRSGDDLLDGMRVHLAAGEVLDLQPLAQRVIALPRDDRWQTMARAALRDDLYAAHARITQSIVTTTGPGEAHERVAEWIAADPKTVARARRLLSDVLGDDSPDLSRLSVGLRAVRTLLSERADAPGGLSGHSATRLPPPAGGA